MENLQNEVKHTPTPWITEEESLNEHNEGLTITSENGETIIAALCGGLPEYEVRGNAEFIVTAVNSHKALLEAAKKALGAINDMQEMLHSYGAGYGLGLTYKMITDAIARAEGNE